MDYYIRSVVKNATKWLSPSTIASMKDTVFLVVSKTNKIFKILASDII